MSYETDCTSLGLRMCDPAEIKDVNLCENLYCKSVEGKCAAQLAVDGNPIPAEDGVPCGRTKQCKSAKCVPSYLLDARFSRHDIESPCAEDADNKSSGSAYSTLMLLFGIIAGLGAGSLVSAFAAYKLKALQLSSGQVLSGGKVEEKDAGKDEGNAEKERQLPAIPLAPPKVPLEPISPPEPAGPPSSPITGPPLPTTPESSGVSRRRSHTGP
jgi:hypothetical protein